MFDITTATRAGLKAEIIKRCENLGVHEHDCWLGGDHEEFVEQFDNDTIPEEELRRVLKEGDWTVQES